MSQTQTEEESDEDITRFNAKYFNFCLDKIDNRKSMTWAL